MSPDPKEFVPAATEIGVIVNPETDFADQRFRVGEVLLVGPEEAAVPRRITAARLCVAVTT